MTSTPARIVPLALLLLAAAAAGCGKSPEAPSAGTTAPPSPSSAAPATTGTLTASPNPIRVCDGSGLGMTRLSWSAPDGLAVEVRVGKPDGALFARTGSVGEKETGKWVGEGAVFYLVRPGAPGTPPSVLGSTEVHVTKEGCP